MGNTFLPTIHAICDNIKNYKEPKQTKQNKLDINIIYNQFFFFFVRMETDTGTTACLSQWWKESSKKDQDRDGWNEFKVEWTRDRNQYKSVIKSK